MRISVAGLTFDVREGAPGSYWYGILGGPMFHTTRFADVATFIELARRYHDAWN